MKRVLYPSVASLFLFAAMMTIAASAWAQQRAHLELQDVKQSASQTEITLTGQVKNISTSEVRGVTVNCDFQGAGGAVIRTEETHLNKDPLKVNETSGFSCSTKASADIRGYKLRFVRLFGGPLVVKPAAPKK